MMKNNRHKKIRSIALAVVLGLVMIGSYSVTSLATANVIGGTEKQVATINAKNGITIQVYNGDVYQIRSALKNAKWFSENSDCVAVTTKGVLTCVGNGKTKIYAKVSGKKALTFTVKVKKDVWVTNWNDSVVSGGANRCCLQLYRSTTLKSISLYHWNGGKGKKAGTIYIYQSNKNHKQGKLVKAIRAIGTDKNTRWNATTSIKLKKGYYMIKVSSKNTWSYNKESEGNGFADLYFEGVGDLSFY